MSDRESIAQLLARARELFVEKFRRQPVVAAQAPGRVNLIGEHTDYNSGLVLPMAIGRWCVAVGAPAGGRMCRVFSEERSDRAEFDLNADPCAILPKRHWGRYVAGVLTILARERGVASVQALDIAVVSSIPAGAGLSSSASLEVATAALAASIWGIHAENADIARLCRQAENDYAGVPCGIMDQLVSACAIAGHALLIDCLDNRIEPISLPPEDQAVFVVADSRVKHDLGAGEYAGRRAACRSAASALGLASLREATPWGLADSHARLTDEQLRCAIHVIAESRRVEEFISAIASGDLELAGQLMLASHESLRRDYRVSCPELDGLVEEAMAIPGVFGSRMTGGGFGGCTVTLCRPAAFAEMSTEMLAAYKSRFEREGACFVAHACAGAGLLPLCF